MVSFFSVEKKIYSKGSAESFVDMLSGNNLFTWVGSIYYNTVYSIEDKEQDVFKNMLGMTLTSKK